MKRLLMALTVLAGGIGMTQAKDFPTVTGEYQMTKEWSITVPEEYKRRFEEKSLVIWRPGLTMWINVWGMKKGETPQSTFEWIKNDTNRAPAEVFEPTNRPYRCYGYLIHETEDVDGKPSDRWALHTFTIGESGHIQMAIYFDKKEDVAKAKRLWLSLKEKKETANTTSDGIRQPADGSPKPSR